MTVTKRRPRIYVTELAPDVSEGQRLLWQAIVKAGSQSALARILEVPPTYLGRWMRGRCKPMSGLRGKLVAHGVPFDSWEKPTSRPFSLPAHAA